MRPYSTTSNGVILYQGPSQLDGSPIVAILTGLTRGSANAKTGNMLQTWILRSDINPYAAIHSGDDASVCGDCPLRGIIEQLGDDADYPTRNRFRACYVNIQQAPRAVYLAFERGTYPAYDPSSHADLIRGRFLRIGSYGDGCAVPYRVWSPLLSLVDGWTGYTHQWRQRRLWRYRRFLMASCETAADVALARSRGWRTFRARRSADDALLQREIICPASAEAGKRKTCAECRACDGSRDNPDRASIAIIAHGSPATLGSYGRMLHRIERPPSDGQ